MSDSWYASGISKHIDMDMKYQTIDRVRIPIENSTDEDVRSKLRMQIHPGSWYLIFNENTYWLTKYGVDATHDL